MANKNKKKIESFEQLANAQQHKRPAASQEEPAISTMLDEFEMWMAVNWKKAIIGVCAFAVLVSVVIIIQGAIQRAELAARRELANAGSIAELEAAIAKHPGNKAADFARLRLAGELITANQPGDLEKAREHLLAVASSSKSETYIKIRSALDAAYILEQLGRMVEQDHIDPDDCVFLANYAIDAVKHGYTTRQIEKALRAIRMAIKKHKADPEDEDLAHEVNLAILRLMYMR